MSESIIPEDPDKYNREVTVIEYTDDDPRGDPRQRKRMKLGDALAEIDNSKQYSFCTCGHDIDEHAPVEDYKTRFAGECRGAACVMAGENGCKQYRFSGIVQTAKELAEEKEEKGKGKRWSSGYNPTV